MLFQILADLLGISSTGLGFPFWKRSRWVGVVKMWLSVVIKACDQGADAKWSNTTFLSILLLCLCNVLWDVFNWWIIVIVQSVWLTLYSCLVCQDSSISGKTWKGHVNMFIELNDLFDSSAFLQFSDGFFLV